MGTVLQELEKAAAAVQRREELVIEATRQGHSRREVQRAAGFKSVNSVQSILRKAGLVTVLALCWAAPASASTAIESPNPIYQQWVDRARVVTPDITVQVVEHPSGCGAAEGTQADGCTGSGEPIYVTPDEDTRETFYHELGHQFDYLTGMSAKWGWDNERFATNYQVCATWKRVPWAQRLEGLTRKKQARACQRLR
jgi:hypothetical protein